MLAKSLLQPDPYTKLPIYYNIYHRKVNHERQRFTNQSSAAGP